MNYAERIRDYISTVALGKIITTRELLHLATRCAVDMTLCRLVKDQQLVRVARGVFVKAGSPMPSPFEVIKAKAAAFGRKIASHGSILAQDYGFLPRDGTPPSFCISAGSTSFVVSNQTRKFVGTCDRKRRFEERPEGKVIRALWQLGRDRFLSIPSQMLDDLQAKEHIILAKDAAWMPAWMSDRFIKGI